MTVGALHTTSCVWPKSPSKSCEELEGRAQFEPQPSREMGLCEERQATPVDLVVTEHLAIFSADVDLHDEGGDLLHCPFVWLSIKLHPLRRWGGRCRTRWWRRLRRRRR